MIDALDYVDAVDAIRARFNEDWIDGRLVTLLGYQPRLYWQGLEVPAKPDPRKLWARLSTQTVLERQATISACSTEPGKRRYTTSGLVFVQLFCPQVPDGTYETGRAVATICRNAFRGKYAANRVVFYNVRINELEPEASFNRFNVVAEYEYDEIG